MDKDRTLYLKGASCSFRHASGQNIQALRDVDLIVPAGQFVCIVGRSGGGKSTLVRAIAGLNPLTSGSIHVGETEVRGPSSARGMVFQEDTVFPWLRVASNVDFGQRAQGIDRQKRERTTEQWLRAVGLAEFAGSWPRELSGGMRKRVALATVFAAGSELLLMDEPFGALDYATRISLHNTLLELWKKTGRTIVFVTHDIEEALVLGDRIVVVGNGRILDDMTVNLPRPRTEAVRAQPHAIEITATILRHLGIAQKDMTVSAGQLV